MFIAATYVIDSPSEELKSYYQDHTNAQNDNQYMIAQFTADTGQLRTGSVPHNKDKKHNLSAERH